MSSSYFRAKTLGRRNTLVSNTLGQLEPPSAPWSHFRFLDASPLVVADLGATRHTIARDVDEGDEGNTLYVPFVGRLDERTKACINHGSATLEYSVIAVDAQMLPLPIRAEGFRGAWPVTGVCDITRRGRLHLRELPELVVELVNKLSSSTARRASEAENSRSQIASVIHCLGEISHGIPNS